MRLAGFWGMKKGPAAVTDTLAVSDVGSNCASAAGWLGDAAKYVTAFDSSWGSMACTPTTGWTQAANTDVLIVRRASAGDQRSRRQQGAGAVEPRPGNRIHLGDRARRLRLGTGRRNARTRLNIYYIATATGNQVSLRRKALRGKAVVDEEVMPGVQDLQVQFGIDADGDGAAEKGTVNPAAVGMASIVAAARIWLLVRAENHEQGATKSTSTTCTATPTSRQRMTSAAACS